MQLNKKKRKKPLGRLWRWHSGLSRGLVRICLGLPIVARLFVRDGRLGLGHRSRGGDGGLRLGGE